MMQIDTADLTDRVRAAGWTLSNGVTVIGTLEEQEDESDPREKGDVYNADVDEVDYKHPTRGFCRHCGQWMRKLSQDEANAYNAQLAEEDPDAVDQADAGHWLPVFDGALITCPDNGDDLHQLDDPLAVRDWRADRWQFVGLRIEVKGPDGTVWGETSVWDVECGTFPYKIDRETGEVEYREINPLREDIALDYAADALINAQEGLSGAAKAAEEWIVGAARSALAHYAAAETVTIAAPVVDQNERRS